MCSPLLLSLVVSDLVIATLLHPRLLQSALRQRFFYTTTSVWTPWGGFCLRRYQHLYPWFVLLQDGVQTPKRRCTIAICYCNKWLLNSKYPSLLIEILIGMLTLVYYHLEIKHLCFRYFRMRRLYLLLLFTKHNRLNEFRLTDSFSRRL